MFKIAIIIGLILNAIGWPLLWNPNIDIFSNIIIGIGLNAVYIAFITMADLGKYIDSL